MALSKKYRDGGVTILLIISLFFNFLNTIIMMNESIQILAKDLRIGNLVYFNGQVLPIYGINKNSLNFYIGTDKKGSEHYQSIFLKGIRPVEIDQELLLNFGFRLFSFGITIELTDNNYFIIEKKNGSYFVVMKNFDLAKSFVLNEIKFAHQLQNLYFAISNKELIHQLNN